MANPFPTPDQLADPGSGAQAFPTPDQLEQPTPSKRGKGLLGVIGGVVKPIEEAAVKGWQATLGHEEPVIVRDRMSAEASAYQSAGFSIDDAGYVRRKNGQPITQSQADVLLQMFGLRAGPTPGGEEAAQLGRRLAGRAVKPAIEEAASAVRPTPPKPVDPFTAAIQEAQRRTGEAPKPEIPTPPAPGVPGKRAPRDEWFERPGAPHITAAPDKPTQQIAVAASDARTAASEAGAPPNAISTHANALDQAIHAVSEQGGFNVDKAIQNFRQAREARQGTFAVAEAQTMMESEAQADEIAMHRMLTTPEVEDAQNLPDKALRAIRDYGEDRTVTIPDEHRTLFHRYLSPLLRDMEDNYVKLKGLVGDTTDPAIKAFIDDTHMPRISSEFGLSKGRGLWSKVASIAKPYNRYVAVGPDGEKVALGWKDGQLYVLDEEGSAKGLVGSPQRPDINDVINTKGGQYRIIKSTAKDIEELTGGKHSYLANSFQVVAHKWLESQRAVRALEFWTRLKSDEYFLQYATLATNPNEVILQHPTWTSTTFPYFRGWLMDPQYAKVFDRIHNQMSSDVRGLLNLNDMIVTLNFVMPTVHLPNQVANYMTTLLQTMVAKPATLPHVASAFVKTIYDILTMSPRYESWVREGAPGMFARNRVREFFNARWRMSVADLSKDPETLQQFARAWGTPVNEVRRGIDYLGQWVAWFGDDVMRGHIIHMLQDSGWSTKRAVDYANRYIPDYRISPASRMGWLKTPIGQAVFVFMGYHISNIGTLVNTIPRLGSPEALNETSTAAARLATMGFIYFYVYPHAEAAIQKALGDKTTIRRAGVYAIPEAFQRLASASSFPQGISHLLQSIFSLGPVANLAVSTLLERDPWTGQLRGGQKPTPLQWAQTFPQQAGQSVLYPWQQIANKGIGGWLEGAFGVNAPYRSTGRSAGRGRTLPRLPGLPRIP